MGANTDISIPILSRMKRGNMKLDLSLDYHAHILPGCDHGSDGLATSLKQVEMAAFLECTEGHYQKIEYGKINLPTLTLIKLADFFDVTTDYLLGRTENRAVNR